MSESIALSLQVLNTRPAALIGTLSRYYDRLTCCILVVKTNAVLVGALRTLVDE